MNHIHFELSKTDPGSSARSGILHTAHGPIETPVFMPVGTVGTVKSIRQEDLWNRVKAPIILGNTYHLHLRPGHELIRNAGGLHQFIGWQGAMLTDSGGYQVFSLAHQRKITEEGAIFRSHIDGQKILFSPEYVMDVERALGADIIMAFDECPPYPCDYQYAKNSMELTHRWLNRCFNRYDEEYQAPDYPQALFPIVQGSVFEDLRKISAEYCGEKARNGVAIGGLSVGEPTEMMYNMTALVCQILPKNLPRYLMGVGKPENILEGIERGVDMFDCVMPTRNARHGFIYTREGIINIKNEKWKSCFEPVDPELLPEYSLAYLRHLILNHEILGFMIATLQNLSFYLWLVKEARIKIEEGNFLPWKSKLLPVITQRR